MPQFDFSSFASQIFWLAITFSVLYLAMARATLPKIREVLQGRQERIASDLEKAESIKDEAEKAKMDYASVLLNSRANARQMITEAEVTAQRESNERNNKLDETLARQMEEAEALVIKTREEVMVKLIPVSVELSSLILANLAGKNIDESRLDAIVRQVANDQDNRSLEQGKSDANDGATIKRAV